MMSNEYLDFARELQRIYLEQQDMENIMTVIDEKTSWIGTGRQEICKNLSEAAEALFKEKNEYSGGFTVTDSWYETCMAADNVCIVFGEFFAAANAPSAGVADLHCRISAVCAKTADGMKLLHLHMSTPDNDQESGMYYVKKRMKIDNQTLRLRYAQTTRDLYNRSQELEILTANIPGGVHQCENDAAFTLVNMSSGFLDMFGYSRAEISSLFNNSFMNMIYEADRAAATAAMREQLLAGPTIELEYRVRCKDGRLVWVLDRAKLVVGEDGAEHFFCMMMDITKRKAEDESLRLALERHRVIMDQATDVIFEWDIAEDTLDFSSNWEKRFGYRPITAEISKRITLSDNIHEEDMPFFVKIMSDTASGVPYSETEFRIKNKLGDYTWCRIRATTQFDRDNRPIKAVGVIVDIEEEKIRGNVLLEAAQRDALTQLYNRGATKTKIDHLLRDKNEGMLHALLIIDVDDFKSINDRFGHQCGDAVLANMAQAMKKLFRTTDVVGRIGGDEFLVFMANVGSRELVAGRARDLVRIFSDMHMDICGETSCSVGIALYPRDGGDYAALSRCADSALYQVKNSGKVNYAFYEKAMRESVPEIITRTVINEASSENNTLNEELVQYTFGMLYNAADIKTSVNQILETVGRAYDVSRVYVFENSEDGRFCSNTFEWCNAGIEPQLQNLQNLSFSDDLQGFFELYDENGVFYCQDTNTLSDNLRGVLEAQGVVSVLQCFIQDDNSFKGYVGFDECKENRYWTKEQIHTLTLVANVLSTFLMKARLKEQLAALKKSADLS